MQFPQRHQNKAAFTLVELLAVIAIIAVLAAILIPVTSKMRHSARVSQLNTNLRTVATAIHLYATDNNGTTPPTRGGTPDGWQTRIKPYLEDASNLNTDPDSLLHDPLDTNEYEVRGSTRYSSNIAINGNSGYPYASGGGYGPLEPPMGAANRPVTSVAYPAKLMLLTTGESQPDAYVGYTMRVMSNAFSNPKDAAKLTRTEGQHYTAFFDGHIEALEQQFLIDEAALDKKGKSILFDYFANNGGK